MDETLSGFLTDLHARNTAFDAEQDDRLARWRTVEPDTAALLALLVRARAPRNVLELGTSSGYSTIWLADAARDVGAIVTTVDLVTERTAVARQNIARAGVADHVAFVTGDAGDVLAAAGDASHDFIFVDAERPAYAGYWPDLRRILAPRGLVVVDNVLSHADEVAELRSLIDDDVTVTQALSPTGAGALLVIG